jgi:hypothetical protein
MRDIMTDGNPTETAWEFCDQTGWCWSISPGQLTAPNTLYSWSLCIYDYDCNSFEITDTYGDGICCSFGNGWYDVYYDNNLVATGGAFSSSELTSNIGNCGGPNPSWDCDGLGSCYDPGTGNGMYLTQGACQANCIAPSWDCNLVTGQCFDPGTGNGQYPTLADCLADSCGNNGVQGAFGSGMYPCPHNGELKTDMIDLSAYIDVTLKCHSYYRTFAGQAFVDFYVNGAFTERVPVHPNVAVNDATFTDEIALIRVPVSVVGNANVQMSFVFDGSANVVNGFTGYYFWMIDDLELTETPNNLIDIEDVVVGGFWLDYANYTGTGLNGIVGLDYTVTPTSQLANHPYQQYHLILYLDHNNYLDHYNPMKGLYNLLDMHLELDTFHFLYLDHSNYLDHYNPMKGLYNLLDMHLELDTFHFLYLDHNNYLDHHNPMKDLVLHNFLC